MNDQIPPVPPSEPPPLPVPPMSTAGAAGGPGSGELDLKAYLTEAWQLVMAEPVLLIVGFLAISACLTVSVAVVIGPLLLAGPLLVGYYQVVRKLLDGEPAEFADLFAGFQDLPRTLIAGLLLCGVAVAGSVVGFIASVVLGAIPFIGCIAGVLSVVLSVALTCAVVMVTFFYLPIIALTPAQPVDALRDSVRFTLDNLQPVALLGLIAVALSCVGVAACGVGALVTMPMVMVIQVRAFERVYQQR